MTAQLAASPVQRRSQKTDRAAERRRASAVTGDLAIRTADDRSNRHQNSLLDKAARRVETQDSGNGAVLMRASTSRGCPALAAWIDTDPVRPPSFMQMHDKPDQPSVPRHLA